METKFFWIIISIFSNYLGCCFSDQKPNIICLSRSRLCKIKVFFYGCKLSWEFCSACEKKLYEFSRAWSNWFEWQKFGQIRRWLKIYESNYSMAHFELVPVDVSLFTKNGSFRASRRSSVDLSVLKTVSLES